MEGAAPSRFDALRGPKVRRVIVSVAAAVTLGAFGYRHFVLKPQYEVIKLRAEAFRDVFALYDLQVDHKKRYGAYAGDLESLLKLAPDGGAALRARLPAHSHLDTLVVAGDAEKFRLEANVRDAVRTLIQVKGPRVGDPLPPKK